ncbi:MAG: signal recognition particle subunit SRP19/SEC65 family protein [Candidatus Bathycorpusculaceae bacterium]
MRKQDKLIIWPAYFDSTKTRGEGRRISKILAVPSPKITEIKVAVEKLGLECEILLDAGYPKTPWLKTGMLLVSKSEAKDKILNKIAKNLQKIRSVTVNK